MSAPFTGKTIRDVYFTSPANDTIEVIYNEGTEEEPSWISVFVSATDQSHYMLRALLDEGYDFEKIAQLTVARKRFESAMWTGVYKKYAAEEIKQVKEQYQQKLDEIMTSAVVQSGDILSAVLKHNDDVDALFRAKLSVFELPEIKNLKDRSIKQRLRTAKTFLQLFAVLNEVMTE